MNNDEKILKALEALQTDIKDVKQGQAQTNERLSKLEDGQTRLTDGQDLKATLTKKVNDHENRIEDLEKEAGIPHPHKN